MDKEFRTTAVDLWSELPKEERLYVYKKAVEHIESGSEQYMDSTDITPLHSLCLLLPCILFNKDTYLSNFWLEGGKECCYAQSSLAFTELTHNVIQNIVDVRDDKEKKELRLTYLKSFIKNLENETTSNS